jgi:hypothetical protein
MWSSIAVVVVSLLTTAVPAFSQQIIKPEDQYISLQGTIRLIHGFGPPGYGEDPKHDAHIIYWALEVPSSVNVPCTPTKPEEAQVECGAAKRLKLFFNGLELTKFTDLPAARWKDHRVII